MRIIGCPNSECSEMEHGLQQEMTHFKTDLQQEFYTCECGAVLSLPVSKHI